MVKIEFDPTADAGTDPAELGAGILDVMRGQALQEVGMPIRPHEDPELLALINQMSFAHPDIRRATEQEFLRLVAKRYPEVDPLELLKYLSSGKRRDLGDVD